MTPFTSPSNSNDTGGREVTFRERVALIQLEDVIERGLKTFIEVGNALERIRDEHLYRASHETFEDYCRERWGFSDRRARQLMAAAEVGTIVPVENEGQARALLPLKDDPEAMADVLDTVADGGKVTAKAITNEVENGTQPKAERQKITGVIKWANGSDEYVNVLTDDGKQGIVNVGDGFATELRSLVGNWPSHDYENDPVRVTFDAAVESGGWKRPTKFSVKLENEPESEKEARDSARVRQQADVICKAGTTMLVTLRDANDGRPLDRASFQLVAEVFAEIRAEMKRANALLKEDPELNVLAGQLAMRDGAETP